MHASRARIDRIRDPDGSDAIIQTVPRAATPLNRRLRLERV